MEAAKFLFAATMLLGTAASAQCTKDIECKGDRICVKGECTDPPAAKTPKASPKKVATKIAEGTFSGIEWGDYAHWTMRTAAGKELSFFVMQPDASVEKVMKTPEKYVGKKCRVQWRKTVENVPEAGGEMELEEIVSVEWL